METQSTPTVHFRTLERERLGEEIASRTRGYSASLTARRDLERYYEAIRRSAGLDLTQGEACLILDTLNGSLMEPHSIPLLWAEVSDACDMDGYDRKWGVDGPALVGKLRRRPYFELLRIVDAVERWWLLPGEERTWPEGLRKVGLIGERSADDGQETSSGGPGPGAGPGAD